MVRMGSGISRAFDPEGEGATSGGVRGREGSEEFVEVSQPPEEGREEMSPSRATGSLEDDRDDFPEEPPREEPPLEEHAAVDRVALLSCPVPKPRPAALGRGGDGADAVPPDLNGGEVRTEPSGC